MLIWSNHTSLLRWTGCPASFGTICEKPLPVFPVHVSLRKCSEKPCFKKGKGNDCKVLTHSMRVLNHSYAVVAQRIRVALHNSFAYAFLFLTEDVSLLCVCILLILWLIITSFCYPLLITSLSFLLTFSLFCKLAALVRHRISLFGKDHVKGILMDTIILFTCCFLWLAIIVSVRVCLCFLWDATVWDLFISCSLYVLCVYKGNEASTISSCLQVLARALDAR